MNYRWPFAFAAILLALTCAAPAQDSKKTATETKPAATTAPAAKATPGAADSPELAAIRATESSFKKAFDAGDAKAVAAHWTADGEFVDDSGLRLTSRDEIEKAYAKFFAANPGARITSKIDEIRLVNGETAIEDGVDAVEPPPAGAPGSSRYTAVHVKRDGKWHLWSVRETRIDKPSNYEHLAALEKMVGTWVAENNGVEFESTSRWIADKNFIEQTFKSQQAGQTISSGTQIIGWDPARQRITSWTFSSDGGHAVGVWQPDVNGWIVESNGTLVDGTPTSAVNIITRLDAKAVAWRSINRTAGAFQVLDTNEIVLKRKAADKK